MKIEIIGDSREIADLILAIQNHRESQDHFRLDTGETNDCAVSARTLV